MTLTGQHFRWPGRPRDQEGLAVGTEQALAPDNTEDRMLVLAYRVVRLLGYSRRSSHRLSRHILVSLGDHLSTAPAEDSQTLAARSRAEREHVLSALRRVVRPSISREQLACAMHDAVLCDEMALLPPRQRLAVRLALVQGYTVEQIAERTGWHREQIARLLRAGLGTVADRGERWQRSVS